MAVNRKPLAQLLQEVQTGEDITNRAIRGEGFDPRGGWGVAAAQIATAGIGAWAQNRARKEIAENEVAGQKQFADFLTNKGYTPESASAAAAITTPEARSASIQDFIKQELKGVEPQTGLAKLGADYKAGLIDKATYNAAIKKETSFAPDASASGGATGAIIANLRRENPNLTYAQALSQVQGLARKAFEYDDKGNIVPQSGLVTAEQTVKSSIKQSEKLAEKSSEKLIDLGDKADEANMTLTNNADARKLLNSGVYTGTGANYKLALGKGLQTAGISLNDDPIANTEAFTALRAQEVGRQIKLFGSGTGLSDADREYATKMAAGQITLSDQSIRKILDISDKSSNNVINLYNKKAGKLPLQVQQYAPQVQSGNSQPAGQTKMPANMSGNINGIKWSLQ